MSQEEVDKLQADHDQVGQDLYDTKQRLLDQLDANHVLTELKYTMYTCFKMMDNKSSGSINFKQINHKGSEIKHV